MIKKIPTILLIVATVVSASTMVKVNSLTAEAKQGTNIFLKEVRKPDGSGYIFDGEEGINISVDDLES